MKAKIKSPTIVMILTLAKTNSASPYIWTAKMFRQTMTTMMIEIHTATEMPSAPGQYWITIEAAEISAHNVIAQAYQFYDDLESAL